MRVNEILATAALSLVLSNAPALAVLDAPWDAICSTNLQEPICLAFEQEEEIVTYVRYLGSHHRVSRQTFRPRRCLEFSRNDLPLALVIRNAAADRVFGALSRGTCSDLGTIIIPEFPMRILSDE